MNLSLIDFLRTTIMGPNPPVIRIFDDDKDFDEKFSMDNLVVSLSYVDCIEAISPGLLCQTISAIYLEDGYIDIVLKQVDRLWSEDCSRAMDIWRENNG